MTLATFVATAAFIANGQCMIRHSAARLPISSASYLPSSPAPLDPLGGDTANEVVVTATRVGDRNYAARRVTSEEVALGLDHHSDHQPRARRHDSTQQRAETYRHPPPV
jgi:hypothetical protein